MLEKKHSGYISKSLILEVIYKILLVHFRDFYRKKKMIMLVFTCRISAEACPKII
jgi:hypothetical protein